MKTTMLLLVGLILSLASCKKKVATTAPQDYKIGVVADDWSKAKNDATAGDKNIVLMLHATWCSHCKTFIKDVVTDQEVANALNNKIIFALVDAEQGEGPGLKSTYGGNGYPFFVITDKNGNKLTTHQGAIVKNDFLNFVNQYLK